MFMKKKNNKKNLKKKMEKLINNKQFIKYLVIGIVVVIAIIVLACCIYLNKYYKAGIDAKKALKGTETVEVSKIDAGYFFDGPGTDSALIFYPGGKVEASAYAPLMSKLANAGVDCFLLKVSHNLAILDQNKADMVLDSKYKYNNWYLSGHSLGGVVASEYAIKHDTRVKGLILLAAYPNSKVGNNIKMLSIYGSRDGVLNMKKYSKAKKYKSINFEEVIITGGNHSNFGDYGFQKGDNEPYFNRSWQQDITVEHIINFINE